MTAVRPRHVAPGRTAHVLELPLHSSRTHSLSIRFFCAVSTIIARPGRDTCALEPCLSRAHSLSSCAPPQ